MRRLRFQLIPALLALLVLSAVTAETLSRPKASDAEPFHARAAEAVAGIPMQIGAWEGTDVEVPPAAVTLLRPNALLNRRYINRQTGRVVDFLIVQCRDARDMVGHYPPVCYPAHGWIGGGSQPVEWDFGDTTVVGTQYEFNKHGIGSGGSCIVYNVMVLPTGVYARDMRSVNRMAFNKSLQFFGAAQVQLLFDVRVPAEEREAISREFLEANLGVLELLRTGGTQ